MHQRRPQVYLLLFRTPSDTQDSRVAKTTVINLIFKCRAPVAFTRHVCNACTICRAWNEWCAMLVLYVMLEMNGVQCLYYMLCLKWMVCNACTICYARNEWCAMLVLYVMLEMNGVQCSYNMLCLKWMVCNARTICYAWNEWCAMLVLYAMLETNDYMLSLRAHFYDTIAQKPLPCRTSSSSLYS